jgi:hypothetical protein
MSRLHVGHPFLALLSPSARKSDRGMHFGVGSRWSESEFETFYAGRIAIQQITSVNRKSYPAMNKAERNRLATELVPNCPIGDNAVMTCSPNL